jgi:hypothetical protein
LLSMFSIVTLLLLLLLLLLTATTRVELAIDLMTFITSESVIPSLVIFCFRL